MAVGAAVAVGLVLFGLLKQGAGEESDAPSEPPISHGDNSKPAGMGDTSSGETSAETDGGEPEETFVAQDDLKVSGYGEPETALKTFFAAQLANDFEGMAAAMTLEDGKEFRNFMSVPAMADDVIRGLTNSPIHRLSGFRIVNRETISDTEAKLSVRFGGAGEAGEIDQTIVYTFKHVAGDWKLDDQRPAR